MRSCLVQLDKVKTGVAVGALQSGDERFRRGLRGAVCERGEGAVNDIHTGLRSHEIDHVARAGGVVRVHMDGDGDIVLQLLDQLVGMVGEQEVCHILDADGVSAHLLQLLGNADKIVVIVDGADGKAQRDLCPAAVLLDGLDCLAEIADIVQRVKDTDDLNAVFNGLLAEFLDDIVGIMLIAEDVLPTEEHLQLGLGHMGLQRAQTLPRILVEEAHADIEGRAAPAFEGPIAHVVEQLTGGKHILNAHTGRSLRLVRVAEDGFCNA